MHPIERWFEPSLVPLFRVSLVLSLVVMAPLAAVDASLRCPTAPLGIVSFELAGGGAADLLAGWTEAQRRDAMLVQGLDYLFLLLYSTALASGALLVGRRARAKRPQLASLARPVAWGLTLAGLFDAVENTPMTLMLRTGAADETGAMITLGFASAKFILLLIGIPYVLAMTLLGRGEKTPLS
jgi:hypothetical protein